MDYGKNVKIPQLCLDGTKGKDCCIYFGKRYGGKEWFCRRCNTDFYADGEEHLHCRGEGVLNKYSNGRNR